MHVDEITTDGTLLCWWPSDRLPSISCEGPDNVWNKMLALHPDEFRDIQARPPQVGPRLVVWPHYFARINDALAVWPKPHRPIRFQITQADVGGGFRNATKEEAEWVSRPTDQKKAPWWFNASADRLAALIASAKTVDSGAGGSTKPTNPMKAGWEQDAEAMNRAVYFLGERQVSQEEWEKTVADQKAAQQQADAEEASTLPAMKREALRLATETGEILDLTRKVGGDETRTRLAERRAAAAWDLSVLLIRVLDRMVVK